MRRGTYLTATDNYCGAGGSAIGMEAAGIVVVEAANHWQLAIETHGANFPHTNHRLTDISGADPRSFPRTDFGWFSPECTNHSLAKGARRRQAAQTDLFGAKPDPSAERSRATMDDVVRFTEVHRYRIVVVENVVDVVYWEHWNRWLSAMVGLGYRYKVVSLNSQHVGAPQSRDRVYIVFWHRGNRAPDLELRPPAWCDRCDKQVEARQAWAPNRTVGKYGRVGGKRNQYSYACPSCACAVEPFYVPALAAIDWTLPAMRIGDREKNGKKPLKERTLGRLKYGLERYGRTPLVLVTTMTTDGGRVRPAYDTMPTQTATPYTAVAHAPFLVETTFGARGLTAVASATEALPTQTTRQSLGLALSPFLVALRGTADDQVSSWASPVTRPVGTVSAGGVRHALVTGRPLPFLITAGSRETAPTATTDPVPTLTASERFAVVHGSAILNMRDTPNLLLSEVSDPLPTQCCAPQIAVIQRQPYLISYYGTQNVSGVAAPVPTVTTLARHGLVEMVDTDDEELNVEDQHFRMLAPHEIQAAMAFPASYKVLGTQRDQVRQLGNAITPPAGTWIIRRCVESLHPELAA